MVVSVSENIIQDIRNWLGEKGINFFRDLKAKYGRVDAIWMEGGIPHVVHFREGMQVRNKLRELTDGDYDAIEYDEMWVEIIERAIQTEKAPQTQ
jgi:hypothetical protein